MKRTGLRVVLNAGRQGCRKLYRRLRGVDRAIIDKYFAEGSARKLHLGCGGNVLAGWLNSDYSPSSTEILRLDATAPFPFEDGVFDFIFSEHMIEHIPYVGGVAMLGECHRVLKPGGKIRISTPSLQFLIDLCRADKSERQREYIDWATKKFFKSAPYPDDVFVVNNFVRDWGHQFIYDEKTLRSSLSAAGFADIVSCKLNQSVDAELSSLENEKRMPDGFLELETLTLEAVKMTKIDPVQTSS